MKALLTLLLTFTLTLTTAHDTDAQSVSSPEEFLGYAMGDRLTPHHRVMNYMEHVAAYSDRVELEYYGESYDGRELLVAYVSTPGNLERLEEIRTNNLRRAGLAEGQPTDLGNKAIVWLSYNVHGNEISSTEAAMFTIYELARHDNAETAAYLENTLVIIDPLLNPDGRDRYVNWFHSIAGRNYDPFPNSREHNEPWPNARTNHYQFDLNRDWAWQTQIETQQRLALYHQWMPHIHADFHEMGIDSPYYFAPAAEPFHEVITDWQREFQTTIGENHVRYFDQNFRLYYTREVFDLFYPSYGDTYPTYNGAIGMTYEQAGNTRGGLTVITAEGDTLTFERRVLNQHIVGLSTVEVTAQHYERVAEEFYRFFSESASNPYAPYKTYVISGNNSRDKMELLTSYLDAWDIQYGSAPARRSVSALDYQSGQSRNVSISGDDLLISAYQPKSALLNVLFEPQTTIVDSLTYDITAWAVPYAMGLEAYAIESRINPEGSWMNSTASVSFDDAPEQPYAYLAKWDSKQDAFFLSQLLQHNVRVRIASQPFSFDDDTIYERGTLIMTRRGNEHLGERFDEIIRELAIELDRPVETTETGFVVTGQDFGSGGVSAIRAPRVALIAGPGVNPNNFGEIWHFLDRQIEYPVSIFEHSGLRASDLEHFDVLIFPEGGFARNFSNGMQDEIGRWVRNGGRLITFGNSASGLGDSIPSLTQRSRDELSDDEKRERALIRVEDRRRDSASDLITGSIYYVHLDNSHPLAYGYPDFYYTLRRGATAYEYLENGFNVGTLRENAHRAGFEGSRVKDHIINSLVFGVQRHGSGQVIYLNDNPLFRAFWHNGALIFANALFFTGT